MKTTTLRVLIAVVLCITVFGCATNPVTGKSQLMLVSESQEIQMGREMYPNALWGDLGGGGEYRDDQLKSYLRDIVLRIHSVSHRSNLPVEFAIQNSSMPNAWAIPGHVVITRGLLAGLQSEAEYAFVMGHEMGHVSARHSASQISQGMITQVGLGLGGVALGSSRYGDAALSLGAVGGNLLMMKFSRTDELEADRIGMQYMSRLGYDPNNAVLAHQSLSRASDAYLKSVGKSSREGSLFGDLMSTHPRSSVRIDELQNIIRGMEPIRIVGDGTYRERYQQMMTNLRSMNSVYTNYYDRAANALQKNNVTQAESLIRQAIAAAPNQPPFHALQGFILIQQRDYATAERSFQEAIRHDGNYQPAYRGLGVVSYLWNDYQASTNYLQKSIVLFPQDIFSRYFLGMNYFRTKNYRAAIPHLQIFEQAQPKHPEIHAVLGISFEQTGDTSSAYQHYLMQSKVEPNSELGKHSVQRASALRSAYESSQKK
ncbi:MAG TPA: M48 family metalloprotease [Dissulfurispiraceae bacterium]|nr:M48 family metalloprotease [Dissulfurispiraceae bacterium]